MPSPKLSTECWNEIKTAYEQGVDDESLSKDFGVTRESIRKRRERDKKAGNPWLNQALIRAEQQKEEIDRRAKVVSNQTAVVTNVTAEASIASKMVRDGEMAGLHAMAILLRKLTFAAENPETVDDLASVGDVAVAVKAARTIAGLDKPETAVQINLASVWGEPGVGKSPGPDEMPFLVEQAS